MLKKMNPLQAIGSIVSLILYLVGPAAAVTLLVIGYGFSGRLCMIADRIFILPVVLMGVTLVVSLLPIGRISSIAGIVTAVAMLILGLCIPSIIVPKLEMLCSMVGFDLGSYAGAAAGILRSLLGMGWGMIVGMIIMLLTALAGMFINADGASGSYRGRSGGTVPHSTSTSGGHSRMDSLKR